MALQNYLKFAEMVRPVYLFNLIVHWKPATLDGCDLGQGGALQRQSPKGVDNIHSQLRK